MTSDEPRPCPCCHSADVETYIPLPGKYPDFLAHRCRECGMRGPRDSWARRDVPPVTTQILDMLQSCLEVSVVGEVMIDEATARAFLAEHRGEKAVMGG